MTWQGNAYTAAQIYFDEFGKKLGDFKETFDSLRSCYRQGAMEAFQLGEVLKAGIAVLADMAIAWMTKMAAAAATDVVPGVGLVGSAAMFALAAYQAVMILKQYAELVKAFETTMRAITALAVTMTTVINGFSAADGFPEVSSAGYDNPVVS